jgi:hydroxymethylglutaryl-CoA lyase
MHLPAEVKIVEVGARDGLQNESQTISTATKVDFINHLSATGLPVIEVGSMVDPKRIPQLADSEEVFRQIIRLEGVRYPVLVPNMQGLKRALSVGAREISIFAAASETFSQKNINCSVNESLERFQLVLEKAGKEGLQVRGYLSCVLGCPYEGHIAPTKVARLARKLYELGCEEISLGDTIGVGTPLAAKRLLRRVAESVPLEQLAVHFHDTRGQALANILACLELGVTIVDSSIAGLGGCPYAAGASGNVATEDLVYMLDGMGIETGVDLDALVEVGRFISEQLGRENRSRVGRLYVKTET